MTAAATLTAGAAAVEITPAPGTHLAGGGAGEHRPAREILDPLFARAAVFECGGRKLCFLALDVTIVTQEWTDRLRAEAARQCGLDPDAVMVHAIQTHSAPPLGHIMFDPDFPALPPDVEYLRGGETAYYEFACAKAIEAIARADADRKPVSVAAGRAVRDGIAFNRRGVTRKGGMCMPWFYKSKDHPLGPTQILYLEGPIDPEVGVFCARGEDGKPVSLLLHYTCHPVNVFATRFHAVSADWPGAWAAEMERRAGGTALVLNGCCGNINPWPAFEPDFVPDHRRMGGALAASSQAALERLGHPAQGARLDWRRTCLPIPLKSTDPERVEWARRKLDAHPEPMWVGEGTGRGVDPEWFRAASIMSVELMRRRGPNLMYEIQAFRVGDTAFVGLPGEPFVEGQLAIKMASPADFTFVAHATTQYVGYVPTREAHDRGGHEVDFSYWAKLAPEALDTIVEGATELLRDLFR